MSNILGQVGVFWEQVRHLWVKINATHRLLKFGKWVVTLVATTAVTTYVTLHVTRGVTNGIASNMSNISNQVQTVIAQYSSLCQQVQVITSQQQIQKQTQAAVATAGIYFPTVTNNVYNTTNIIKKETIDIASLYTGWEKERIEAGDTNRLLTAKMTNGCTVSYLRLKHTPIEKTIFIAALHDGMEQSMDTCTLLGNIVEVLWDPQSNVDHFSYRVSYVRDPNATQTCSAFRIEDGFLMFETNRAWSVQWRFIPDNPRWLRRTVLKTMFTPQMYALYDLDDRHHVRYIHSDVTGVSTQIVDVP